MVLLSRSFHSKEKVLAEDSEYRFVSKHECEAIIGCHVDYI